MRNAGLHVPVSCVLAAEKAVVLTSNPLTVVWEQSHTLVGRTSIGHARYGFPRRKSCQAWVVVCSLSGRRRRRRRRKKKQRRRNKQRMKKAMTGTRGRKLQITGPAVVNVVSTQGVLLALKVRPLGCNSIDACKFLNHMDAATATVTQSEVYRIRI